MVFGGAQVMVTLINVIRGKLVAMVLGATGIGMSSLLTNAANSIMQATMLGVNQSGVRDVSQAQKAADHALLLRVSRIIRTMMFCSALAGMTVAMVCSPLLARYTADDVIFWPYFLMLGVAIFFNTLGLGEYTILQGTRQYKSIAYGTVLMPLCSLLVGVPIYYFWRMDGIVPAMIVQAVLYYAVMRRFTNRHSLGRRPLPHISLRDTWRQGKGMITFGMVMMLGSLLGSITTYAISALISTMGLLVDVGYFYAANTITMQCSALVFTAMATDYYPKLSGIVNRGRATVFRLVNQQAEIVLLVIAPIAMLIILVAPVIIRLLLTDDFLCIRLMMRLMGLAVIFKAACFPFDYIALAKGDKRFFFVVEGVFSNVRMLVIFPLGYYIYGLDGLGYAALLSGVIDTIVSISLTRWRYGTRLSRTTVSMFFRLATMGTACLAFSFIATTWLSYTLMAAVTIICGTYSYRQLDKRIGIKSLLRQKLAAHRANISGTDN